MVSLWIKGSEAYQNSESIERASDNCKRDSTIVFLGESWIERTVGELALSAGCSYFAMLLYKH